jgi:hypothetical protein
MEISQKSKKKLPSYDPDLNSYDPAVPLLHISKGNEVSMSKNAVPFYFSTNNNSQDTKIT